MPPFNLRNIFTGHSRRAEHPDYQYPLGSFPDTPRVHSQGSSHGLHSRKPYTGQWTHGADHSSRGSSDIDYDDQSDSSTLLTDGVLVPDAAHIPAVHRQISQDSNSYLDDEEPGVVPVRHEAHRRGSQASDSTSTRSSNRTGSDHSEIPPQIIPEYSRPYADHRSEYTSGTRYAHTTETHPHERDYSRSRSHRGKRRRRSGHKVEQGPVILMFENGRGGYDNMWYVMPGSSPVIFQDSAGNEITRVGDFSHATPTHTQPPILLDQYGRHPNVHVHQTDSGSGHYAPQVASEYNYGSQRHGSARGSPGSPASPTPSVTFINLRDNGTPQPHHLEPLRANLSPQANVVYMDSRGRPSPPTSSRTSSRSHSVASDQGRSHVSHPGTVYT